MIKGGMGHSHTSAFDRCRFTRSRTTYPEIIQLNQYLIVPREMRTVALSNVEQALSVTGEVAPTRVALRPNPFRCTFLAKLDRASVGLRM